MEIMLLQKILSFANIMLINLNYILFILILSLLIIILSKKGYVGNSLKRYCESNGIVEFLILLIIFSGIFTLIVESILLFIQYNELNLDFKDIYCNVNPAAELNLNIDHSNPNQDPVRWWPSGTPQSWGVIGAAVATYRTMPGNPITKTIAALATLGVSIPMTVYVNAVKNFVGFNRLMYGWIYYKRHGNWPLISNNANISDNQINQEMLPVPKLQNTINNATNTTNTLLPNDINNLLDYLIPDKLINKILNIFRPVEVEGYLDDLI